MGLTFNRYWGSNPVKFDIIVLVYLVYMKFPSPPHFGLCVSRMSMQKMTGSRANIISWEVLCFSCLLPISFSCIVISVSALGKQVLVLVQCVCMYAVKKVFNYSNSQFVQRTQQEVTCIFIILSYYRISSKNSALLIIRHPLTFEYSL